MINKETLKVQVLELFQEGLIQIQIPANADAKISALPDGGAYTAADYFPVARSGTNVKISQAEVFASLPLTAAVLVETGSAEKTSAMTDAGSYTSVDVIPIARSGQNYKLSQAELLAAIPGGAPSILTEGSTSEKTSAMPDATTYQSSDVIPIARSGANYKLTQAELIAAIPGGAASLLVESGSSAKISALTDAGSYTSSDFLAISRSGQNYKLSQAELIAALPSVSPAVLMESGSSTKISAMTGAGSYNAGDLMTIARSGVNYSLTQAELIAAIPLTGSFDPFDAKVTADGQLETALGTGKKCINIAGNIHLTANITLSTAVWLYLSTNSSLNLGTYQIDMAANDFTISSDFSTSITYAPTISGNKAIINSSANKKLNIFNVTNIINTGTATSTELYDSNSIRATIFNTRHSDNGQTNSCLKGASGSAFYNVTLVPVNTTSSALLVLTDGAKARDTTVDNAINSGNNLIDVQETALLDGLDALNNPILINAKGMLDHVNSTEVVSLTCDVLESSSELIKSKKLSNADYGAQISNSTLGTAYVANNVVAAFSNTTFSSTITLETGASLPVLFSTCNGRGSLVDSSARRRVAACMGSIT